MFQNKAVKKTSVTKRHEIIWNWKLENLFYSSSIVEGRYIKGLRWAKVVRKGIIMILAGKLLGERLYKIRMGLEDNIKMDLNI
jgi:hypothetical protein